jgi:hypothetical protein
MLRLEARDCNERQCSDDMCADETLTKLVHVEAKQGVDELEATEIRHKMMEKALTIALTGTACF